MFVFMKCFLLLFHITKKTVFSFIALEWLLFVAFQQLDQIFMRVVQRKKNRLIAN